MDLRSRVTILWTVLGCGLLLVHQVLRAASESLTVDEAYAYFLFIRPGAAALLANYSAAHHVLQTLLSALSVEFFGVSEIALRGPSIAGFVLFCGSIGLLFHRARGNTYLIPLAVAFLATNPLLLGHFALARGYGLGASFFSAAVLLSVRLLETPAPHRSAAGLAVALGLSIASNLVFVFPAAALVAMIAVLQPPATGTLRSWLSLVQRRIAGPAFVLAFCIVAIPISHAEPGSYYFGSETMGEMARSLMLLSFHHADCAPAGFPGCDAYLRGWWPTALWLLVNAAVVAGAMVLWKNRRNWQDGHSFLALLWGLHSLTLFAWLFARLYGTPYPWGRTGIPLVLTLSLSALAPLTLKQARIPRAALLALIALATAVYIKQLGFTAFAEWRSDAGSKPIAATLVTLAPRGGETLALHTQAPVLSAIQFYLDRQDTSPFTLAEDIRQARFLIYDHAAADQVQALGFEPVYWHPVSHTGLAVRQR